MILKLTPKSLFDSCEGNANVNIKMKAIEQDLHVLLSAVQVWIKRVAIQGVDSLVTDEP